MMKPRRVSSPSTPMSGALATTTEDLYRENRRLTHLLKAAGLRTNACVEDMDYRHPRGFDRAYTATLASCHWVQRQQNLCMTGPTGSGKTWLSCALGNQPAVRGSPSATSVCPGCLE